MYTVKRLFEGKQIKYIYVHRKAVGQFKHTGLPGVLVLVYASTLSRKIQNNQWSIAKIEFSPLLFKGSKVTSKGSVVYVSIQPAEGEKGRESFCICVCGNDNQHS